MGWFDPPSEGGEFKNVFDAISQQLKEFFNKGYAAGFVAARDNETRYIDFFNDALKKNSDDGILQIKWNSGDDAKLNPEKIGLLYGYIAGMIEYHYKEWIKNDSFVQGYFIGMLNEAKATKGFDMGFFKKRIKRIDVKKLDPQEINNLGKILAVLK